MSGSENVLRPSADLAREKTEAAIKASRQNNAAKNQAKNAKDSKSAEEKCDAVKNMASFENEIGNVSPNATNLSH